MNETEADPRAVLAVYVRQARKAKFRTVDEARIAAGIARGTWEKVENAIRVKDFSLAAIERALEWAPGDTDAILAGRLPSFDREQSTPSMDGITESLRHLSARVRRLELMLDVANGREPGRVAEGVAREIAKRADDGFSDLDREYMRAWLLEDEAASRAKDDKDRGAS